MGLLKSKVFWVVASYFIVFGAGFMSSQWREGAKLGKAAVKVIKQADRQVKADEALAVRDLAKNSKFNQVKKVIREKTVTVRINDFRASDESIRLYNEAIKAANSG